MGVKLAETAGFCMGVRRAVNLVLDKARNRSQSSKATAAGKGSFYINI